MHVVYLRIVYNFLLLYLYYLHILKHLVYYIILHCYIMYSNYCIVTDDSKFDVTKQEK